MLTGRGDVSSQIDLASCVLDDTFLFGDTEDLIAAADRAWRAAGP
ncbi:MAG: hypothetical protein AAGC60_27675 [Acidobacteriota bacterium]